MNNLKVFESYLEGQGLSVNGVKTRISRCNKVEKILREDLDSIVSDDKKTFDSLNSLNDYGDHNGNLQNALRKYYEFKNKKEFPRLKDF